MAFTMSPKANKTLTALSTAKAKLDKAQACHNAARTAAAIAIFDVYRKQFRQIQQEKGDTKPLTAEFLTHIATVVGQDWATVCGQQHPNGGPELTACLQLHGDF